jgi:hypothetical protein
MPLQAKTAKESLRPRSVRRVTEPGGSRPGPTIYPVPGRLGQSGRRLTVPGPAATAPVTGPFQPGRPAGGHGDLTADHQPGRD